MILAGGFALVMAPYGLWRGVWPLNVTTPFFAAMLGGMSIGATFLYGGLFAPAGRLRFSPGYIDITYETPWGRSQKTVRAEEIVEFTVEENETSEGPNDWYAVMKLSSGEKLQSRPLSTAEAAKRQLAEFQAALSEIPE